jgi:hypothetical protein
VSDEARLLVERTHEAMMRGIRGSHGIPPGAVATTNDSRAPPSR